MNNTWNQGIYYLFHYKHKESRRVVPMTGRKKLW